MSEHMSIKNPVGEFADALRACKTWEEAAEVRRQFAEKDRVFNRGPEETLVDEIKEARLRLFEAERALVKFREGKGR